VRPVWPAQTKQNQTAWPAQTLQNRPSPCAHVTPHMHAHPYLQRCRNQTKSRMMCAETLYIHACMQGRAQPHSTRHQRPQQLLLHAQSNMQHALLPQKQYQGMYQKLTTQQTRHTVTFTHDCTTELAVEIPDQPTAA
jgi:hypothetical protein